MIIQTENVTYPDYSFEIIETHRDRAIINTDFTESGDYEIPIDIDYEDIDRIEGDRVTGRFRHEWNAETLSEEDLRKQISENFIYRKAV